MDTPTKEKEGIMEVLNDSLKGTNLTIQEYLSNARTGICLDIKQYILREQREIEMVVSTETGKIKCFRYAE